MFGLLLALQYECTDKFYMPGMTYEYGGDCPDDVACSKRDAKDAVRDRDEEYFDDVEITGKYAQCAVGNSPEECDALCKEPCTMADISVEHKYTVIQHGSRYSMNYLYYCPRGKQRYGEDSDDSAGGSRKLSAGAIAGIVVTCIVVVIFCICYFLVCKKRKSSQAPVQVMAPSRASDNWNSAAVH